MDAKSRILRAVTGQLRKKVDSAAFCASYLAVPKEGWVKTVRASLGMTGSQLAARNGVSRAAISKTQKAEINGGITINQMKKMAESMGCQFVYGIVPSESIEKITQTQAVNKANKIIRMVSTHMALEDQLSSQEDLESQRNDLVKQLMDNTKGALWDE